MKLEQDDVTRICQRVVDHEMDTQLVADQFDISRRRVQQLVKTYRDTDEIPTLQIPGLKPYANHPEDLQARVLELLNLVDIVSYSKRDGTVQFKESDQVEEQGQASYRTTRRTPYSNLMRFRKALRDCAGDLLWIDRHFSKKGLEPLAEEVTGDKFSSVRILCGPAHELDNVVSLCVDCHRKADFGKIPVEILRELVDAA